MPAPSSLSCRCPSCGTQLWAQRKGQWTLANRILKYDGAQFLARCPDCASDVPVPFLLLPTADTDETPPQEQAQTRPISGGGPVKLVVRVDKEHKP